MSRFLSGHMQKFEVYAPGEQPQDRSYIKLNTNECPYPPGPMVQERLSGFAATNTERLRLYPDPSASRLKLAAAAAFGLAADNVFAGGGSDEILGFAFMAFFDPGGKVYFPDITYGFYEVYANLFNLDIRATPLNGDFVVDVSDYFSRDGHIVIANPNAPTGIALDTRQIEDILRSNRDRLVIIDEAYVDFSDGKSCVGLINRYDNLLVIQTFSKSRAFAGMRLGLAFGCPALIDDLERVKYAFNPYNIDTISMELGAAALEDAEYFKGIAARIIKTRGRLTEGLKELKFDVLHSEANFLFARRDKIQGGELYRRLKDKGVLVRHFSKPRINDFVRITIGTDREIDILLDKIREILAEHEEGL